MTTKENNQWKKSTILKGRAKGIWINSVKDSSWKIENQLMWNDFETISLEFPKKLVPEDWWISDKKILNLEVEIIWEVNEDITWEKLINYIKTIEE